MMVLLIVYVASFNIFNIRLDPSAIILLHSKEDVNILDRLSFLIQAVH